MKNHLYAIQLAFILAACCARGQGTLIYDQQVSNISPPGGYGNIQPDPSGESFIPSLSAVGFIQLYLSDGNPTQAGVTMYVNLWSGSLANGALIGQTTSVTLSGTFFGSTNFIFSTAVSVTPGTTYYFQPIIQSGDSEQIGIVAGNSYASGTAFFQGAAQSGSDLWFREGVIAMPEPSASLLTMLGIVGIYLIHRKR